MPHRAGGPPLLRLQNQLPAHGSLAAPLFLFLLCELLSYEPHFLK